MNDRPVSKVLQALYETTGYQPKRQGKGWTARCPAHDDRTPSLAVSEGDDGRVLMYCHAGCTNGAVCDALGIAESDLFPTNGQLAATSGRSSRATKAPPKTYPTADAAIASLDSYISGIRAGRWAYTDAEGKVVAYVVRYNLPTPDGEKQKKTFRPVSLHPKGWCNLDPPGTWPLYNLQALADADHAYLVEGEGVVEALRGLGLVATTSAHGGMSPHKTNWEPLAGKTVTLIPDHDDPGRGYRDTVIGHLSKLTTVPVIKAIELPDLPPGGDAVDYIEVRRAAGLSDEQIRAEIEQMADEAPVAEAVVSGVEDHDEDLSSLRSLMSQSWPDPLDEAAFYGLAGDIVRAIEPHTEADPVALLIDLLVSFGNMVGRNSYFVADGAFHYPNMFVVMVGRTAKGRKGTARVRVRNVVEPVEPDWAKDCVQAGLSSGEGLIWAVRDPIFKNEAIREKGKPTGDYQDVQTDEGVADKRLLITEGEFASVLRVAGRDGSTLSPTLRQAWDKGDLRTLTKNSPAKATGAHISIIGHITGDELRRYMDNTESANGFANRFIWQCVERSKCLPEGGKIHEVDFDPLRERLMRAVEFGKQPRKMQRDGEARAIWIKVYPELSEGKPGMLGAITSRAEAQVMRLAMIFALLDCSSLIRAEHIKAALAVWERAEQAARYIFGDALGDPVADELLAALRRAGAHGMTRTDIRDLFRRHKGKNAINQALASLLEYGYVRSEKCETGGRTVEVWFAT